MVKAFNKNISDIEQMMMCFAAIWGTYNLK